MRASPLLCFNAKNGQNLILFNNRNNDVGDALVLLNYTTADSLRGGLAKRRLRFAPWNGAWLLTFDVGGSLRSLPRSTYHDNDCPTASAPSVNLEE
jgi:hypothetical protein